MGAYTMSKVGEWTLAKGSGSFTSPKTITDTSSNSNNGTCTDNASFTSGTRGSANALVFNGISQKVTIGNTGETVKSVSIWVNLDDNTTRDIIDFDGGTHVISVDGSGDIIATGFSSPTIYINNDSADPAIAADIWTNVIVKTATGFTASNLVLGYETTYLDGDMANVRLYDDELTDGERYILYWADRPVTFPTTSGLAGWWTLRSASAVSTKMHDRGTGMNHGTSANAPSFTTGPIGESNNAMTLNGTTDKIIVANNSALNFGVGDFSISCWMKSTNTGTFQILVSKGSVGAGGKRYDLYIDTDNKPRFTMDDNVHGIGSATGASAVMDGNWHNIIGVADRDGNGIIYIDNVAGSPTDFSPYFGTIDDVTKNLGIGVYSFNESDNPFNGDICNVRIYNRVLTAAEITTIYNYELTGIPQ